jgi:protease II
MEDENITSNINLFGYIEMDEARKLMSESFVIPDKDIDTELILEFNRNSGLVFYRDHSYNYWLLDENEHMQRFHICGCGIEGNKETQISEHEHKEKDTREYQENCKEFLEYLSKEKDLYDEYFKRG